MMWLIRKEVMVILILISLENPSLSLSLSRKVEIRLKHIVHSILYEFRLHDYLEQYIILNTYDV